MVSQRTGIINQIRAFLLERGVAVRQGLRFLRAELPDLLVTRTVVAVMRKIITILNAMLRDNASWIDRSIGRHIMLVA